MLFTIIYNPNNPFRERFPYIKKGEENLLNL